MLFTLLLPLSSTIYIVFGAGCHGNLDISNLQPTIGVQIEDVTNGDSEKKFIAAVYTDAAGWSEWTKLDHSNCDDRERGEVDYYDDFNHITDEWTAISLYNCATDGTAIDGVYYWDGVRHKKIDIFCHDVSSTLHDCYEGDIDPSDTGFYCYNSLETRIYYDYLWLDQNGRECHGATFATGNTLKGGGSNELVATKFPNAPSIPNCDSVNAMQPNNHNNFIANNGKEEESVIITTTASSLFDEIAILIGVIILLVCSNIVLVTIMIRKNTSKNNKIKYSKVDVDSC